jgi:hypothetical protein
MASHPKSCSAEPPISSNTMSRIGLHTQVPFGILQINVKQCPDVEICYTVNIKPHLLLSIFSNILLFEDPAGFSCASISLPVISYRKIVIRVVLNQFDKAPSK